MRTFAIGVLVLAACGGGSKSTTPKAPAATCASVADAMVGMMLEGKEPRPPQESIDELSGLIRTRCSEDHWTAEAQHCLSAMKSGADAERCSAMLTDEQQANLVRDQQAKYGAPEAEVPGAGDPAPPPPAQTSPTEGSGPKQKGATRRQGDPCDGGE